MPRWIFYFKDCNSGTGLTEGYVVAPTLRDARLLFGNHPHVKLVLTSDDRELPDGDGPVWYRYRTGPDSILF